MKRALIPAKAVASIMLLAVAGHGADPVTSTAMHLFPELVRRDLVPDGKPLKRCAELDIPFAIRKLPVDELKDADEIFLATTAGGIMPASRIDGRIMGNDRPGPISSKLRETFWKKRAEGWHAPQIIRA